MYFVFDNLILYCRPTRSQYFIDIWDWGGASFFSCLVVSGNLQSGHPFAPEMTWPRIVVMSWFLTLEPFHHSRTVAASKHELSDLQRRQHLLLKRRHLRFLHHLLQVPTSNIIVENGRGVWFERNLNSRSKLCFLDYNGHHLSRRHFNDRFDKFSSQCLWSFPVNLNTTFNQDIPDEIIVPYTLFGCA